jgi:peptidoglycan/LPS O-acetylase OafA/YrhL
LESPFSARYSRCVLLNERISLAARPKIHLDLLDTFRGVAIILVFLYHIATPPSGFEAEISKPWDLILNALQAKVSFLTRFETAVTILFLYTCRIGWCGVAIFFVVSGFCIHIAFCQSADGTVTSFYLRRFFRIYPPYILALLFFATVFPVSRLAFTRLTHCAQLATHVLLIHNSTQLSCWAIDSDYWSIAVEAQLYLLFPVMLLAVRRWRWGRTLLALAAIEFTLCAISAVCVSRSIASPVWLCRSPFTFWFSWSIGAAIADAYLNGLPIPFRRTSSALWLLVALATSAAQTPSRAFSFSFFALFTATIISHGLSKIAPGSPQPNFLARCLRTTGRWSYSLYLIHHPILIAVADVYRSGFPEIIAHPLLSFAAGLSSWIIIFPVSGLMYNFVEKPSISIGKKVLNRWAERSLRRHLEANAAVIKPS